MEPVSLYPLVLAAGGHAAPDMPLGLVLVQNGLHLPVQHPVTGGQTLRQILMYGGFADAELFGGGADGGPVLYQVQSQLSGSLLQVVSDNAPLPCSYWTIYMGAAAEI